MAQAYVHLGDDARVEAIVKRIFKDEISEERECT
jgi:hypothetical protein